MTITIDEVRALTGCGLQNIHYGMKKWPTDDPLLAGLYMYARSCAINVKGDRDTWNRNYATRRRKDFE